MANSIHSNSVDTGNSLRVSQNKLNKSLARLSTGLRLNSAKDDAAGLAISDRMNAQIRGLNQSVRNSYDGMSLLQTADGAMSESTDILQRMRELSVQSSNGIYSDADRASMNDEFSQLQDELDRIAGDTTFNGQKILDGSLAAGGIDFQIGPKTGDNINVTLGGVSQADLGTAGLGVGTLSDAQNSLDAIDNALGTIASNRGAIGSQLNRFESTVGNLMNQAENITAANSRIADADIAAEVSASTQNSILQQAGVAVSAQANQSATTVLSLLS